MCEQLHCSFHAITERCEQPLPAQSNAAAARAVSAALALTAYGHFRQLTTLHHLS